MGTTEKLEEELSDFTQKINLFCIQNCPSWLTPNSTHMGIVPGHNLDLFQISFDFKIDRRHILRAETPDVLKDPSLPDLKLLREDK